MDWFSDWNDIRSIIFDVRLPTWLGTLSRNAKKFLSLFRHVGTSLTTAVRAENNRGTLTNDHSNKKVKSYELCILMRSPLTCSGPYVQHADFLAVIFPRKVTSLEVSANTWLRGRALSEPKRNFQRTWKTVKFAKKSSYPWKEVGNAYSAKDLDRWLAPKVDLVVVYRGEWSCSSLFKWKKNLI